ncbi:ABC transporter, ATP-binding protein [Aphelenchoides fujianensis]|nr:ABC transporter, ATP-binding protein [Aphelenchoides fujianensis]
MDMDVVPLPLGGVQYCNDELTWFNPQWSTNSSIPLPSWCFQHGLLVMIPPAFFFLFLPMLLIQIRLSHARPLPEDLLTSMKQSLTVLLIADRVLLLVRLLWERLGIGQMMALSEYIGPIAQILTLLAILKLKQKLLSHGIASTGVIFLTWLLFVITGLPEFYFLLHCFTITHFPPSSNPNAKPSPESQSSFLARQFVVWFSRIVKEGKKRPLSTETLYDLDEEMESEHLAQEWNKRWQPAVKLYNRRKEDARSYNAYTSLHTVTEKTPLLKEHEPRLMRYGSRGECRPPKEVHTLEPPSIVLRLAAIFKWQFIAAMAAKLISTFSRPESSHVAGHRTGVVDELQLIRKAQLIRTIIDILNVASPFLVALVSFSWFTLSDPNNVLTSRIAFVSLTVFSQLRQPLFLMADLVGHFVQVVVSNRRLKAFLVADELDEEAVLRDHDRNYKNAIEIETATFAWDPRSHSATLRNISLQCRGTRRSNEVEEFASDHEHEGKSTVSSRSKRTIKSPSHSAKELKKPLPNRLIADEFMETSRVKRKVYWAYIQSMGVLLFLIFSLLLTLNSVSTIVRNFWLSDWSNNAGNDSWSLGGRLGVFAGLGVVEICFMYGSTVALIYGSVNSSFRLHGNLLQRIMHAPIWFFDTTPAGRILNRFGKDLEMVDLRLSSTFRFFLICVLNVTSSIVVISISTPLFILICKYHTLMSRIWLGVRLEIMGSVVILSAAALAVLSKEFGYISPGIVGLAVSYSLNMTFMLNFLIRSISEMESNIVAVERIEEYSQVEQEPHTKNPQLKLPKNWPTHGQHACLKEINLDVRAGEKLGIAGRTGAGKTSFSLALFRLIQPMGGRIVVDGVNIQELDLHDLRGSNISVGQRQLISMARAILRKSKIIVFDEATASVDLRTDQLIQATMREKFEHSTVLTIAHRTETIMDYDRIMVLDHGHLVELDTPQRLLENPKSVFYSMIFESICGASSLPIVSPSSFDAAAGHSH